MITGAEAFQWAMTAEGLTPVDLIADDCRWWVNGQDMTDCAAAFGSAPLAAIERIRDKQLLAADGGPELLTVTTKELLVLD